jgi:tetratricopeptide (TPR) repeat protein
MVEAGVARAAGWSLPSIGAALGRLMAPTPRLAVLARRAAALRADVEAADHPDAAHAPLVDLTALAAAAAALQDATVDALDTLDAELERRLPEQIELFELAAGDTLRAVDNAVAAAVAARLDGEQRVEALPGAPVSKALADLVGHAITAQSTLSEGRAIAARLGATTTGRAGRALLDDVLDVAAQVEAASRTTLDAREALECAAEAQEAVNADRADTIQRLRARIDAAQVAYDEIELTVEASREALTDAPPAIAARWQALLLETGEVSREIARARIAARRAAATVSAEDLADAREEAEGALQAADDETARLSATLPELLGTQIQYAQATRDLLESRMSTRHAASRVERFAADLAAASADAMAALTDLPDRRDEWLVASAALDALRDLLSTLLNARDGAEATEDDAVASAHAAAAAASLPDAEAWWQTGKAACVRLLRERVTARRARAHIEHGEHQGLRSRAAWVLGQRAPLAAELRRWSRAVPRWASPWSDDDAVAAAATDALALLSAALERDVEVVEAARRAISAPTIALAAERVELAEAAVTALHADTLAAHAAVVATGEAVQAAHAAATARREAHAQRQAEAAQAIERLRSGLGAAGPSTRIPLFEKGLAVARLRGDRRALLGWLIDTAELYDDAGRLADARRLLDEAVRLAPDLGDERLVSAWLARGRHLHRSGDPAAARDDLQAALERTEDRAPVADDLHGELGLALLKLGDEDEARSELELAAELAHVAGDVRSTGLHLGRLARLASAAGDLDEAEHHANAAAEAMHAAGDAVGLAAELARRADILRRLGRVAEAVQVAQEALDVAAHDEGLTATLRAVLGWCWLSAGQPARAHGEFTAAAAIATRRADGTAQAHARAGQAACARAQAIGGPALTPGLAWAASKETRRRARRTDRLGLDRSRALPDQLAVAADAWADAADQALAIGDLPAAALRRVHEAEARAALGDPAARATAEAALDLLARLPRSNEALVAAAARIAEA